MVVFLFFFHIWTTSRLIWSFPTQFLFDSHSSHEVKISIITNTVYVTEGKKTLLILVFHKSMMISVQMTLAIVYSADNIYKYAKHLKGNPEVERLGPQKQSQRHLYSHFILESNYNMFIHLLDIKHTTHITQQLQL